MATSKVPFASTKVKFTIGSLDEPNDPELTITAQYNPKELQVDRNVPWAKPPATNKSNNQGPGSPDGGIRLEFTGAEGRSVQVELLFDGVETDGGDVETRIRGLQRLASVRKTDGDDNERRPHHCIMRWGDRGLPSYRCVIASLSVKYQVFSDEGKPLRATATVKLNEADTLTLAKQQS
jgi:hypothetical protein